MGTTTVRVVRRFDYTPDHVFDAWLDRDRVRRWMATGSDAVVRVELDARVGGRFSFVVQRQGQELDHHGEYVELDRPNRLSFTWAVGPSTATTTVHLDFEATGPSELSTELQLTHVGVPEEYKDLTHDGWSKILDAIDASLG